MLLAITKASRRLTGQDAHTTFTCRFHFRAYIDDFLAFRRQRAMLFSGINDDDALYKLLSLITPR